MILADTSSQRKDIRIPSVSHSTDPHCVQVFHSGDYDYGVPSRGNRSLAADVGICSRSSSGVIWSATTGGPSLDRIRVCVRKRPRNRREIDANDPDVVTVQAAARAVVVDEIKTTLDLTKYKQQVY